ncbi:MAG TPA: hypothetical protein VHM01_01105 [Alphaproteobacteria bacterium]|nr:hypothetical protein [Alphaproteobacteria bacterium]
MSAANVIMLPAIQSAESVRHTDARNARAASPIIDAEPAAEYVTPERPHRAYRDAADSRHRDYAPIARFSRPKANEPEATSLGFAAQRIAQEELSEGLYFENFRPAIAAYAAADSNFTTVRRPPLSSVVIWA